MTLALLSKNKRDASITQIYCLDLALQSMIDVVVVGLGGVGSFALRALSKRAGVRIVGLERFKRCHDRGSSHGGSRIYRKAYFEHPSYVPWIQYSEEIFHQMGVMVNCGTLIMEEPDGATAVINRSKESATIHGIETEFLSNAALRERYPQFRLCTNKTQGLLEPGGGFVRPEEAMAKALEDADCEILENVIVDQLIEHEDHVELQIVRGKKTDVMQAKQVIVSSGAWTSDLIPSLKQHLTVTRQLQAWIDVGENKAAQHAPDNMPTWYMSTPNFQNDLYGIPTDPKSENPSWVKFGIHCRDIPIDPSYSSPHLVSFERRELADAAAATLVCEPKFALAKPCLYTMTPDDNFIIGRPAPYKRVVCAAGLSGHGFKMTPAIGEMLTDLALGEGFDKWQADFVSPRRFGA